MRPTVGPRAHVRPVTRIRPPGRKQAVNTKKKMRNEPNNPQWRYRKHRSAPKNEPKRTHYEAEQTHLESVQTHGLIGRRHNPAVTATPQARTTKPAVAWA